MVGVIMRIPCVVESNHLLLTRKTQLEWISFGLGILYKENNILTDAFASLSIDEILFVDQASWSFQFSLCPCSPSSSVSESRSSLLRFSTSTLAIS